MKAKLDESFKLGQMKAAIYNALPDGCHGLNLTELAEAALACSNSWNESKKILPEFFNVEDESIMSIKLNLRASSEFVDPDFCKDTKFIWNDHSFEAIQFDQFSDGEGGVLTVQCIKQGEGA